MKIVDYNDICAARLNALDSNYWGYNESDKISDDISSQDIVKIALDGEEVIGMIHLKIIGDLVDLSQILVDSKYTRQGIGTQLMKSSFSELSNINTIIAHAVEFEGHINSKKILENFGFHEIYRIRDYWKSIYPDHYCKQCDSRDCHCGVVVYMKEM